MNYRKVYIILLLLLSSSLYSQSIKDSIVARINDKYVVKYADLQSYFKDWNYARRDRDLKKSYNLALNDMVINQLKRFDFFNIGLDKNPEIKKLIAKNITEEIKFSVYEKIFIPKYVNEERAKQVYKTVDKEVDYYQVIIPFTGDSTKTKEDSLEKTVLNIKEIFQKSTKADEIARKVTPMGYEFSSKNVADWKQELKDEVIHEVFNSKVGEVKAFKAFNGYYIVKAIKSRTVKKASYNEMKSEIMEILNEAYREEYEHDFEEYKVGLFDKKSISWNQKTFDKVLSWANIPEFFTSIYSDTLDNAIKKNGNEVILTYNNGKVDLVEYKRLLDNILTINSKDVITGEFLKDFILEAVRTDLLVKKEKEQLKEEEFFNPFVKSVAMKHRIAYIYNKTIIEDKIPKFTEEVAKKFYEDNISTLYYQLEKHTIYARVYSDSVKAADEVKTIKNSGISFEKYSDSYLVKTYEKQKDGSLTSYWSTEPPYLAEAAFKLKLNELAGPIKYIDKEKGKQYAVITCSMIRPEKQLTYEEVRNRIKEDFTELTTEKLFSEVEKNLRAKYKVELFPQVIDSFLNNVKK